MNPQTCSKFGANRSSRLTASQDFWICDPLTPPPPAMPPGLLRGELYLYSQMNPPTWTKVGANRSSRLTASRDFWNVWTPKIPPQVPPCVSWGNLFGVYPFPDEAAHVYQIWCQSDQPFDIFPWLLNLWPPNPPPPPPNVEGRIVHSLCPFPDESADVYQMWCQSVQPFDSLPDFWICDPLVYWGSYIHSQMNLHMCAKFGINRSSRLVAFPEFVLR